MFPSTRSTGHRKALTRQVALRIGLLGMLGPLLACGFPALTESTNEAPAPQVEEAAQPATATPAPAGFPPTETAAPISTATPGVIINPRIGTIVIPRLAVVSGASASASPTSYEGPCPFTVTWHGAITATGALTATYVWEVGYLDGTWTPVTSTSLAFSCAGTMNTVDQGIRASFSQLGKFRLHVTSPNSLYFQRGVGDDPVRSVRDSWLQGARVWLGVLPARRLRSARVS